LLFAYGLGAGITRSISVHDAAELPRLVGSALAYAPALWVFVGLVAAIFGLAPRASGAVWAAFGVFAFNRVPRAAAQAPRLGVQPLAARAHPAPTGRRLHPDLARRPRPDRGRTHRRRSRRLLPSGHRRRIARDQASQAPCATSVRALARLASSLVLLPGVEPGRQAGSDPALAVWSSLIPRGLRLRPTPRCARGHQPRERRKAQEIDAKGSDRQDL
jgi:hypothetical protein